MGPDIFKKGGSFVKAIALFMVQAFLLSSVAFAVPTTTATDASLQLTKQKEVISDPEKLIIPRDAGLVKSKYAGKSGRMIFHIQDAHCNFEAQANIAKIIETFVKNYNLSFVAVEGADGIVDTSWFKAFPDEDVRKEVATYFMKKGEITGPEFLSITTNYPIKLFGAETRAYYIENLNAFTSSYPLKAETEKYYNNIKSALTKLKGYIYSDELKALDQKMADYESKKMQFNDYVRMLQAMAEKHKINLREYENFFKLVNTLVYEKKINFEVVDKERSILIDQLSKGMPKDALKDLVEKSLLFKANKISSAEYYDYLKAISTTNNIDIAKKFPNLSNYIIYNSVYSKIENELLFKDIKKLELAIKENLFQNDDQRTLESLSRHIDILIGLVNIKLLNDDFDYYKTHKDEFTHEYFADFIKKKGVQYGLSYELDGPTEAVASAIPKLEDFYKVAIKRDFALVENTLKQMEAEKQDIGVLVTGGFHSEGIAKLLEKQGVSYAVICPSITKDVPTPYIQILTNQRTSFEDILVSAADAKKGMLAPAPMAWLDRLNEQERSELKVTVVGGQDLIQRLNDVKSAWTLLDIQLWLGKALSIAVSHKLAQDMDVMKEAFTKAMELTIAAARPNGQLTTEDISLIQQITGSKEFQSAFETAYTAQTQALAARTLAATKVTQGAVPAATPVRVTPAAQVGQAPARAASSIPSQRAVVTPPAYTVTRGQAYSSAEAFNQYVANQMLELMKVVPGLEDMMKKYRALPSANKAEQAVKADLAKKIDTLIRLNYNAKIAAETTGMNFSALTDSNVVTNIPNLTEFVATPDARSYIDQAEALMVSSDIGKIDLWAGAASRLFGEGQNVDTTLSYAAHDVYAVAKSRGQDIATLQAKGAMPGISMATRLAVQEWLNLEAKLRAYYQSRGAAKSNAEIVAARKNIIYNTPRVVIVNDESGPSIIKEFVNNNFYGHNPELVAFVVQPTRRGFDIENGVAKIVTATKPTPAGHGDATMQIVQDGRAFTVDAAGKVIPVEGNAIAYLMAKTNNQTKLFVESRVNDMMKLDTPVTDNPAVAVKDVDLGILALSLSKMGDLADLTKGNNVIFEMVGQDLKAPIKGSSPVEYNGRQALIESLAQDDNVARIVTKEGVPFNRFYVIYKPAVLTEVVKPQGLPIYFRFRDGYIYPETVTSDATMLNGTNAGFAVELSRQINDYKDGDKTLVKGIDAALKQDNDPLFKQYVGEVQAGRQNIELAGLDNAPGLAGKAPKTGDAIAVTGQALSETEHTKLNDVIRNAFESTVPAEKAIKKDVPPALAAKGLELYVIPGMSQFDEVLIAHPGRGGEAMDHKAMRVYVSPMRYGWAANLTADAQAQFWAHELEHITSKNKGEFLTEEEIQKLAPIDKVLEAVKAEAVKAAVVTPESAIAQKFEIKEQTAELKNTLTVLTSNPGLINSRKVILAYDTALDPKENTSHVAAIMNKVLEQYIGARQIIVIKGTGEDLLEQVMIQRDALDKEQEKYAVVTLASDATLASEAISEEAKKELGRVINVKNNGDKQVPVIGLFDLALKIAYELGDESILRALNKIALNPNNPQGFTKDDLEDLLRKGFLSILPKIQRINTSEAVEAYKAATQALKSL